MLFHRGQNLIDIEDGERRRSIQSNLLVRPIVCLFKIIDPGDEKNVHDRLAVIRQGESIDEDPVRTEYHGAAGSLVRRLQDNGVIAGASIRVVRKRFEIVRAPEQRDSTFQRMAGARVESRYLQVRPTLIRQSEIDVIDPCVVVGPERRIEITVQIPGIVPLDRISKLWALVRPLGNQAKGFERRIQGRRRGRFRGRRFRGRL